MKHEEFAQRFKGLLKEMDELMLNKNHDYAGEIDPLANLRMCEKAGIPAWKGIVGVRMTDKMSRLLNFCNKETLKVKDESFKDTLRDIAVYALLGIIAYDEDREAKGEPSPKMLVNG